MPNKYLGSNKELSFWRASLKDSIASSKFDILN